MEASLHANVNDTDHRLVDISRYSLDDLSRFINELNEARNHFDIAAVTKHKLKKEYESCQIRLKAAIRVSQR